MFAGTEINFSEEEGAGWILHLAKTRFFGIRFTVECGFANTFTPKNQDVIKSDLKVKSLSY